MEFNNSYAIVAYIGGPVAGFVDRSRNELEPGCRHHAHITVLPPRPLRSSPAEAIEFARPLAGQFEPFEVRVGPVEAFPHEQVIYLAVAAGTQQLQAMHGVLNASLLESEEAHRYLPHITLGQQLAPEQCGGLLAEYGRRWQAFGPPPPLRIETLTFVQQRADGTWADLAQLGLGRVTA